jgi:hypothetical protein
MVILNSNQQQIIGWLSAVPSGGNTGGTSATTTSTLSTSLFAVWNGDTTGVSLDTSIYGVWNADALGTSLDTSIYGVYNGDNVNDTSGNAQNGTNVNNVTFTTGKVGNAFTFNGSNYVTLPNNSMNFTGDFSISAWVNFATLSGARDILSTFTSFGGNYFGVELYALSYFQFNVYNGTTTITSLQNTGAPLSTNTWYNLVITRKASTGTKMYINGTLNVSNTSTQNPVYTTTNYATIGGSNSGGSYVNLAANGTKIDGLTIWNKELTANEVASLYNTGTGAEYPFSSQTLPSPNDAVSTNHGTLMNGCTFATGKIGKAFTFDGVNDYVQLPDNAFNSLTGSFSVSAWFKTPSSIQAVSNIIFNNRSGNTWFNNPNGFILSQYGNGILFDLYNNTNSYTQLRPSYTFSPNTWYHITATKLVNGNMKVYINGELIGTLVTTVNPTYLATVSKPCIGVDLFGSKAADYFAQNGFAVDALSVWNKELTASEVSSLYNGGTGAQYPFSGQTLATSNDAIGTNHGTLMNGATFATGKIGQAFSFDGINDYVALPNNSLNLTGDFSVSTWVYLTAFSSEQIPISNYYESGPNAGNARGWMIYMSGQNLYWIVGGSSQVILITSISSFQNTWKQITITFKNGVGSKIYFDGNLVTSNSSTVSPIYNSTQTPFIGKYQYGNGSSFGYMSANSKVDAVSVWNRALTAEDATELYNSGNGKQYPNY